MVFRGQPSMACEGCRIRRTKCDTQRPSCSQCNRSGRQCKGYRELADMIFRDETKTIVAKRNQRAQGKTGQGLSTKSLRSPRTRESRVRVGSVERIRKAFVDISRSYCPKFSSTHIRASAEDQAASFFFHNYIWDNQELKYGNFQYLSNIIHIKDSSPALVDCITALGLAGLANFWKASNIMVRAHAKYNSAIKCISLMLAANDTVRSDQTLVTVMLLGLYETNTCSGPQSMKLWTNHINGAITLLHLRGKHQFSSPLGRQIFAHLRTQAIINCIRQHIEVPAMITRWSRITLQYESPIEAAATQLAFLGIQFAQIRASMSSFYDHSNSVSIIVSMNALDAKYTHWASNLPPEFLYIIVPLLGSSIDVFGQNYQIYSSLYTATLWNHYRSMRILINEIVSDQLSFHLQSSKCIEIDNLVDKIGDLARVDIGCQGALAISSLRLSAQTKIHTLSHDICASVPFFLSSPLPPALGFATPSQLQSKSVCGNLLLWPLYTAACTWMVSDVMREWVAARLLIIADTMGIRQAVPLAQSLMMTLNIDNLDWKDEPFGDMSKDSTL